MGQNAFKEKRDLIDFYKEMRTQNLSENNIVQKEVPDNLFVKCKNCGQSFECDEFKNLLCVCNKCGHHNYITAKDRIDSVVDRDSFIEFNAENKSQNPLNFAMYDEKLAKVIDKTGLNEAIVTGVGKIDNLPCAIAVMDSAFLMASMGCVVGEKLTLLIEYASYNHLPLIIFTASGGARMQEGIFALMQMAKTAQAIQKFSDDGGLYIACLTNPTTGGVSASFASLADITLAEPDALIGFAGRRVIEQTIGQKLPQDFQRAEYLEKHGFIDRIIERKDMRKTLSLLLKLHKGAKK